MRHPLQFNDRVALGFCNRLVMNTVFDTGTSRYCESLGDVQTPVETETETERYARGLERWKLENETSLLEDVFEAAARAQDAYERKAHCLNLSGLSITSIPPVHQELVELDLTDCHFLPDRPEVDSTLRVVRRDMRVVDAASSEVASRLLSVFEKNRDNEEFLVKYSEVLFETFAHCVHYGGEASVKTCGELYERFLRVDSVADTIDAAETIYSFEKDLRAQGDWNMVLVRKDASAVLNFNEFLSFFSHEEAGALPYIANLGFFENGMYSDEKGRLVREFPVFDAYRKHWLDKLVLDKVFSHRDEGAVAAFLNDAIRAGEYVELNER